MLDLGGSARSLPGLVLCGFRAAAQSGASDEFRAGLLSIVQQLDLTGWRHEMSTVTSADGTVIDYDRYGDGPAVVFIGGASIYRAIDESTTQAAVIQARLGHATITETMDTYGHLFPDAEDLGRGAIDAIFAVALTEQERNQEIC
jgi:hypothetical protein